MSQTSAIQAAFNFITIKCKEITEHPSQINLLNSIIEKYL